MTLAILAVADALAACASPRYAETLPEAPRASAAPREASEVALFPPPGLAGGGYADFQLPLQAADLSTTVPRPVEAVRLADVRSGDALVGEEGYRQFVCGWKHVYTSQDDSSRPAARTCPGPDGRAEKAATYPRVFRALQELRSRAAAMGANAVLDVRCFVFSDRWRLWCEGAAAAVARP